jgi:hypothetical protein
MRKVESIRHDLKRFWTVYAFKIGRRGRPSFFAVTDWLVFYASLFAVTALHFLCASYVIIRQRQSFLGRDRIAEGPRYTEAKLRLRAQIAGVHHTKLVSLCFAEGPGSNFCSSP